MAAGKGTRLLPLTLETPKPLIEINGERMIERIIRALHINGIYEIYVVVGYLKDKFQFLEEKYKGLKLIENPYYDTCNNISSLYVARDYLENCMIIDGDQVIYNRNVLSPYFDFSGYNAVKISEYTNEWLLQIDENNIIKSCNRNGGENGYQLYGISRWSKEDGQLLQKLLEEEFIHNNNTQIYWGDVAMFCHFDKFKLGIYEMKTEEVLEIDTYEEYCALTKIKYG